ncbi:MAG: hypothetical protein AB3N63_16465 [Puniceicoccaceae bacterium]
MKVKVAIVVILLAGALILWNIQEFKSLEPDTQRVESVAMPELAPELPRLDWKLCDAVEVEVVDAVCRIVSLPPGLEELDGKEIVVSGPSFACGEDLVEHKTGYTIKGFIMVPYFGMVDCCIGNPIPYFQWTVVVEQLTVPWEIPHKGIIDPDVVVKGTFRIERGQAYEGIFFLDDAVVIHSADAEKYKKETS